MTASAVGTRNSQLVALRSPTGVALIAATVFH